MKFTPDNTFSANGKKHEEALVAKKREALTKREKEVLGLVADGHTADEIAVILFVSLDTVESHRRNIISKMKAKNTANAVAKAMRKGFLK